MRYGGVEYAEAVPRTAPAVQDQSKDQLDLETEVVTDTQDSEDM